MLITRVCFVALLTPAGISAPQRATAETYTLIVHESPAEIAKRKAGPPEGPTYWSDYADYGKAMSAAGVLRGGGVLEEPESAAQDAAPARVPEVANRAGLRLGGYFVIDVPDRKTAMAWAAKAPAATRAGRVDVHAAYPAPTMP